MHDHQRRVHGASRKKLKSALRYDLERKGTDDFAQDVLAEENEADPAAAADLAAFMVGREEEIERPEDAKWPEWSFAYYEAWQALLNDRYRDAMGGFGGIYFTARHAYASRNNITGNDFAEFDRIVMILDDEYVMVMRERAEAEAEKNKGNR